MQSFAKKQKCLNLGPKMRYLGIFDQNCLIWIFIGKSFKTTIVIYEISTLIFVYLQNFMKNQKCLIYVLLGWNMKTLSNCKIWWKHKNAYIWDEKCLIWVFLG